MSSDISIAAQELSSLVANHLAKTNDSTGWLLANENRICVKTITKARQGLIKKKRPAVKIIMALFKDFTVEEIQKTLTGTELGKIFDEEQKLIQNKKAVTVTNPVNEKFNDESLAPLLALLNLGQGLHETTAIKNYGKIGISKLEELVKEELVSKNNDDYYSLSTSGEAITISMPSLRSHAAGLVKNCYDAENASHPNKHNGLRVLTKRVNKDVVMPKLAELINDFVNNQVVPLFKNNAGTDAVYFCISTDTILREDLRDSNSENKNKNAKTTFTNLQ